LREEIERDLEKKIERGRVSMSERQIVGKRNEEREERETMRERGERERRGERRTWPEGTNQRWHNDGLGVSTTRVMRLGGPTTRW